MILLIIGAGAMAIYYYRPIAQENLILQQLHSHSLSERTNALRRIDETLPIGDSMIRAMERAINDEDWELRNEALKALARVSKKRRAAFLLLETTSLENRDCETRASAIGIVATIASADELEELMVKWLGDQNSHVQWASICEASRMQVRSERVLDAIDRLLGQSEGIVKIRAAGILMEQPRRRIGAFRALKKCLQAGNEKTIAAMEFGLRARINGETDPEVVVALTDGCKDSDPHVRAICVQSLQRIGDIDVRAKATIVSLMNDPDSKVRLYSVQAVDVMKLYEEDNIIAATKSLAHYPASHSMVFQLIENSGRVKATLPIIESLLMSAEEDLVCEILIFLAKVGPQANHVVPSLTVLTKSKNARIRSLAADALVAVQQE